MVSLFSLCEAVRGSLSANEHAVPITVEAIPSFDRMMVCRQRVLTPGKGANERE